MHTHTHIHARAHAHAHTRTHTREKPVTLVLSTILERFFILKVMKYYYFHRSQSLFSINFFSSFKPYAIRGDCNCCTPTAISVSPFV